MEMPAFNISESYAIIIKTMFITAFYASIIPLSLIISCVGLYIHLWV